MSLEADLVLDRLRMKRRLVLWRILAVAVLVLALFAWAGPYRRGAVPATTPHLVRLAVDGIITDNRDRIDRIDAATRDPAVRGMVLFIDSPGGSVAGGEALHDAVARFAAAKPVVVAMGGVAASAGYMIAVPAARIFCSNATLTGSIGVILQSPDLSGLLGKLGIGVDELVSGPLKGQPSVVKPLSPEGRAMLQDVVSDLFGQFVDMVAQGRHMDPARVRALADGRPYTGHQALALGLVDQIGDERDARAWLEHGRHLPAGLPVVPLKPPPSHRWLGLRVGSLFGELGRAAMQGALDTLPNGSVGKTVLAQGVVLDGAVSLWQP